MAYVLFLVHIASDSSLLLPAQNVSIGSPKAYTKVNVCKDTMIVISNRPMAKVFVFLESGY